MNEQLTDQVLIERVQNGDKQAFNLLVLRYQNKVCNLISRYVSNSGDVADVAQEAFIKAYRAIPTFVARVRFTLGCTVLLLIPRKITLLRKADAHPQVMLMLKKLNSMKVVTH